MGTNGGSAWTRPGTVPADSATVLVNHTDYDSGGRVLDTIDPRGIKTGHFYDVMGHEIETVAAWDGTQNPTAGNSTNQITDYTFDANGDVLTMTAVQPTGGATANQTTAYVYGTTGTPLTNLFSNELVTKVEYPDKATGNASTAPADDQSFTYNLQGDKTSFTDQNGTTHTYHYDVLARLTADIVTTLGSGVDGSVRRLGYSFDSAGRPYQQTSYSDTGGTTAANQVQDAYDGFGQLTAEYQSHSGAVNTSTSPKVQYGYTETSGGTVNNNRLTSMTYPNGRVVSYGYNTGLDSTISRVSSLIDGATHLVDYTYLGLSTIVQQSHPQPNLTLTYIQQAGDPNPSPSYAANGGDRYTGLDAFGRVVDQLWMHGSVTSLTDRFQYAYDQDSNALYRQNVVNTSFGELYHSIGVAENSSYDNLNRLTKFARGVLSSSGNNGSTLDQISSPSTTNNWNLDALGNWTGTGAQSRTFNSQNQITSISGKATPAYDNNGNMTADEAGNAYKFDAWNRMATVNGTAELLAYDADGRRIQNTSSGGAVTDSYYSSQWQDLEDDVTSGGSTAKSTFVWSQSYVDDLVARDDASGTRLYAQQDLNHDVTAVVSASGSVVERFVYDPYGVATVLTSGWQTTTDGYQWVYMFQGGRFDAVSGLYSFRSRDYSPALGRWISQDRDYSDSRDLYEFLQSRPPVETDPTGRGGIVDAPGPGAFNFFGTNYDGVQSMAQAAEAQQQQQQQCKSGAPHTYYVSGGLTFVFVLGGSMSLQYAWDDCGNWAWLFVPSARAGLDGGIGGQGGVSSGSLPDIVGGTSWDIWGSVWLIGGGVPIDGSSGFAAGSGALSFNERGGASAGVNGYVLIKGDLSHKCPPPGKCCEQAPAAAPTPPPTPPARPSPNDPVNHPGWFPIDG